MTKAIFILYLLPVLCFSQNRIKTENSTTEGIIESYLPNWGIALSVIKLKTNSGYLLATFPSYQGKEIANKFPTGSVVKVLTIARVPKMNFTNLNDRYWVQIMFADSLCSIQNNNERVNTVWKKHDNYFLQFSRGNRTVMLDQIVERYFEFNGEIRGVYLKDDVLVSVSLIHKPRIDFKNIPIGSKISNAGWEIPIDPGDQLIYPGASRNFHPMLLQKVTGFISSFLFKQNGNCIGLMIASEGKAIRLNFPADMAEQIMKVEKRKTPVTVYFGDPQIAPKLNLYASLHAIISESDTLKIESEFFGDPDGKHDYNNSIHTGKITKLNRDLKDRIVSIIIDNKVLIESNYKISSQLNSILKKGTTIKVDGQERIKKQGEVYQNGYSVMTPKNITVEGKEFLVEN